MNTKKLFFYILAAILGGCIPVMSLNPLFTEKDITFDEKLIGTWGLKEDPNGAESIWDFKRADANENAYKFTFIDKEGKKGTFDAHLVKLDNRLFLDVYPSEPPWDEKKPDKIEWLHNTFFFVPVHTFIKVNAIEPQLRLQLTDDDELKKLLEEDPNAIEHASNKDQQLILTASTEELQAFVLKYADDSRVFTEEGVLNRKETKASQESVKQKPDEPNDPNKS